MQKVSLTFFFVCLALALTGLRTEAAHPHQSKIGDALESLTGKKSGGVLAGMAVVDMNRLYNASSAADDYDRKLVEISNDAQQRLKAIAGVSQLGPAELQEFVILAGKTTPTETERDRQKTLADLSEQRNTDYRALQGKTGLTPAENGRLQAFIEQDRLFRDQLLPNIGDGFRQGVSNRMEAYRTNQLAQIRTVVGQVAKQKGMTHVFDITVLVYCENDLTAAVLQKLNKKK